MAGLRTRYPEVRFLGIGGPLMEAEGLQSLVPMQELAVMGIAEVLPRLPGLLARIRQTAASVLAEAPGALITIDSPDFCLRVARKVRARNPAQRVVHYVAPSVWAWRPERAAKMAPIVDQVLCLLPFEPHLMEAEGMRADFVGHPVASEQKPAAGDIADFRAARGTPLILALPGSRKGEVERICPIFGEVFESVARAYPDARVVLPAVAHLAERVAHLTSRWPLKPEILSPDQLGHPERKSLAFAAANVALAASGTVSLELAAADTPMVIAYDMNWLSRRIIASKLRIDTVTLVNLVSESRDVPEFLGENCKPQAISDSLLSVLRDPDKQRPAMRLTMERLGRGGVAPGLRAADAVLDGLSEAP